MRSVGCPNCGREWIVPAHLKTPSTPCPACAKPIKLVMTDDERLIDEGVRDSLRESRQGVWLVATALIATVAIAIKVGFFIRHDLRYLSPYCLLATVIWLGLGGAMYYWYRRSGAGEYHIVAAAFRRQQVLEEEQGEAAWGARHLIAGGGGMVMFLAAFARGFARTGPNIDDTPFAVILIAICVGGGLAVSAGAIWILIIRFKSLQVAGFCRSYFSFTIIVLILALFN